MSQADAKGLRVEIVEGVAVVRFLDERIETEEQVKDLRGQLYSLVDDGGYKQLLLNLDGVQVMISLMLWPFLGLKKRVDGVEGQLRLCCLGPVVREAFRLTGLLREFKVHDDEASALDQF